MCGAMYDPRNVAQKRLRICFHDPGNVVTAELLFFVTVKRFDVYALSKTCLHD